MSMDIKQLSFLCEYQVNGRGFTATSAKTEHFTLSHTTGEETFSFVIKPEVPVEITRFAIKLPVAFDPEDWIYVNGYQSWTDSLEYRPDGQMKELTKLTEYLVTRSPLGQIGFSKSGDLNFHRYPRRPGVFYGWSYGYIRRGGAVDIFGSLSERSGYTIVTFDVNAGCVVIEKDLEGVVFSEEQKLIDFAVISGEYDAAFDRYFEIMGVCSRESRRRTGYTTWYNYYSNINEAVVRRDLKAIGALDMQVDCFQIDDGYQAAIGDWLTVDAKKFPQGMQAVADEIHRAGMTAGLWLAPFAGVKKSALFREHPDWFIKDPSGKPYKTGHNWGGFYSLDIYHPGVRDYLKHVFDVVLNTWGFDLVKLDFLYGACVLPLHGKSRGEVMCDAMDLLRECCGEKLILGCGVPLMPAFGKVDYCRIGSDISLNWTKQKHAIREEVSTPHAVCNTIFRRHLNGRAWMNDPDVFLLREANNKMRLDQRILLSEINSVFGSLLFISDDVGEYNGTQLRALAEAFGPKEVKILRAELEDEHIMTAAYTVNGEQKALRFDVRTGEQLPR